ncbi:MAG: hypothetical protein IK016_03740 [Lachnospiraceae bacterium]|nr:hypothetical protein [Lachnospiraceae bacterium]
MLTIKAPVELKCAVPLLGRTEGFAERIRGNYCLMGAHINETTLTFLMNTPPEVIVAPSEGTDIRISNTAVRYGDAQLNVFHNMMNRILMTENVSLTYQDRAFITDVLHKTGIRNAQLFMNQVRSFMQETRDTKQLTTFCLQHIEELYEMAQTFAGDREETHKESVTNLSDESVRMFATQIFNRLQSGAIWQIVNNMTRTANPQLLPEAEVRMAAPAYVARQMLLTRFRELATHERQALVWRAENRYEPAEEGEEGPQAPERETRERITSAVLLEMIRNLDHALQFRTERTTPVWTDLTRSFYRSSDRTIEKMLRHVEERQTVPFLQAATEYISQTQRPGTGEEAAETAQAERVETLKEIVTRLDQKNAENRERYREIRRFLMEQTTVQPRPGDRERTIRESLRVLENRDYLQTLMEKDSEETRILRDSATEKLYAMLPPQTAEIFRETERVLRERAEGTGDTVQQTAALAQELELLAETIHRRESGGEVPGTGEAQRIPGAEAAELMHAQGAAEMPRADTGTFGGTGRAGESGSGKGTAAAEVPAFADTLFHRENYAEARPAGERKPAGTEEPLRLKFAEPVPPEREEQGSPRRRRGREESVSFVHKREQVLTQEELLETIEEVRKGETSKVTTVTQDAQEIVRRQEIPVRMQQEMLPDPRTERERAEEVARLVESGIRTRMNSISNEVYTRLERRLKTEKARRGI